MFRKVSYVESLTAWMASLNLTSASCQSNFTTVKLGYNELGYNELGYNELGYNEQNFQSQMISLLHKSTRL